MNPTLSSSQRCGDQRQFPEKLRERAGFFFKNPQYFDHGKKIASIFEDAIKFDLLWDKILWKDNLLASTATKRNKYQSRGDTT